MKIILTKGSVTTLVLASACSWYMVIVVVIGGVEHCYIDCSRIICWLIDQI